MKRHRWLAVQHAFSRLAMLNCVGLLTLGSLSAPSLGQTISTVVGPSTADNVPAVTTGLYQPVMTFVDGSGNIYFSDHLNHRVRKIDTFGIITTLAGNGTRGFSGDGGPAVNALVDHPYGVYVDAPGNVYFCDLFNHRVRKIDTAGQISTVAGNGTPSFSGDGGPAAAAGLNNPIDVIMDSSGSLYISESTNRRIRKVDPGGIITTFAGNGTAGFSGDGGPAVSASLTSPYGMDFDIAGNLYFGDIGNHRVRRIDTGGTITTVAGSGTFGFSGDGGPALNAWFRHPWDVAVGPSGDLFIADFANHRVRKVNTSGIISTFAGSGFAGPKGDGGPATAAGFNGPVGVAFDGSGNLYVADLNNYRIRKIDTAGIIATVGGGGAGDGGPVSEANLNQPYGVAVDGNGNMYIADGRYQRIRKVDPFGVITRVVGTGEFGFSGDGGPATLAETAWVQSLHVDPDGVIYIPDSHNNRVRRVDLAGNITTVAGSGPVGVGLGGFAGDGGPASSARLSLPIAVHSDAAGNLYISDYLNHRIRKVDATGIISTIAGTGVQGYSGDGGPAVNATIRYPWGIHADAAGNVYFADGRNYAVRKIDSSGIITTVAGTGTAGYTGDGGLAVNAKIGRPFGIHVDAFGNLLIADTGNYRVRMVDPTGVITTVAGSGGITYNGDGIPATAASLYNPMDVVTDSDGSLYIADRDHNRLRKVVNVTPPTNQPPTVYVGGPYSVDEGGSVAVTATGSDPDGDPLTYAWDLDNDGTYETPGQTATFSAAALDGPSSATIGVEVTDGQTASTDEATVTVQNVAPIAGAIVAPLDPVAVDTEVSTSASFTDPGVPDTHTASWDWGDGNTSAGTVDQANDTVGGTHTYTAAGVYTVTLTVTDDDGGIGTSIYTYVVVYDPNGGFVTGGGWIDSPAGAYVVDPGLTGKANFGFVSKYQNGQSTPTGQTQFKFKAGDLKFHSTDYEWLVVAGPQAKYKGSGTINGQSGYDFMLTGRDGQANGGGGVDKFRIKIWDASTESVVYDNQLGDADDADATDAIGGGSITIHNGGGAAKLASAPEALAFGVGNYPNPFNPSTTIRYSLPEASEVRLTVYSALGQEVRTLVRQQQAAGVHSVQWDGRDAIGRQVATGLYLYRLQAGTHVAVRKMVFAK